MAAQRKLKGKAGISFSEIDVRSAKIHQCLVLFPAFQEQRTRFSTAVPANEAIATTAFDAQMCTAQNLKPGGTSLGAFAFRGGYIRALVPSWLSRIMLKSCTSILNFVSV
jgi:hypothetical protein